MRNQDRPFTSSASGHRSRLEATGQPLYEQDLGYRFHPPRHPHALGHPQLDIVLRATPTERHFDPEEVRLTVAAETGGVESLIVRHPWTGFERAYRVCAGCVALQDRKEKAVEAFTFGGTLRLLSERECTACSLVSPVPIIHLVPEAEDAEGIPTLLATEIEALLAIRRAAWTPAPEVFEKRLAAADPLALYVACLEALLERTRVLQAETLQDDVLQLAQVVIRERKHIARLAQPPLPPPCLELLL